MKPLFLAVSALFVLTNLCFFVDNTGYSLILIPLTGLIAYYTLRDRIEIHYQFKIFAVLMGVVSLLLSLQTLFGWAILSFSPPNLLVADSIALVIILLLRTHGWLKLPVTFAILAGMILLPQGLWAIILVILVYTLLSHTEVRGQLYNLLKVGGFTMVSLIIISTIFPTQVIRRLSEGVQITFLVIPENFLGIANIALYLLAVISLIVSFRYVYDIFAIKFKNTPPDEIEHNNILMILAILILVVIYIPIGAGAVLQPVFWLSVGVLWRYQAIQKN